MMRKATKVAVLYMFLALLSGCDELHSKLDPNTRNDQHSTAIPTAVDASSRAVDQRFVFPVQSKPFPDSSVALDTRTGQLCKTYVWVGNKNTPSGLPLCADFANPAITSAIGATKAYRGFTYMFDGSQWKKGSEASKFKTNGDMEPWSDDHYDPLNLLSKEEKAKRLLTDAQISQVAHQFGVTYEEAWEDAKAQGYQVPTKQYSGTVPTLSASSSSGEKRFVFPATIGAFPAASAALDTSSGRLCKTYAWADTQNLARGLPLCSELTNPAIPSLVGATKAYRGYTYMFDGRRWNKGKEAWNVPDLKANPQPMSDDQYDPLSLLSKGEKAKRILTKEEIQRVAEEFGVSYEQASEDAKAQGYQVPPNH